MRRVGASSSAGIGDLMDRYAHFPSVRRALASGQISLTAFSFPGSARVSVGGKELESEKSAVWVSWAVNPRFSPIRCATLRPGPVPQCRAHAGVARGTHTSGARYAPTHSEMRLRNVL